MGRRLVSYVRRHHLALLALFVALGGTSYAAARLPANSVGSKQVIDRSLRGRDFKAGQLPKGARGEQGARGPTGPQGARGATGTPDPTNFYTKAQSDARFLQGGGGALLDSGRLDMPNTDTSAGTAFPTLLTAPGFVTVLVSCYPGPRYAILNTSGVTLSVVHNTGGAGARYELAPGALDSNAALGPAGRGEAVVSKSSPAAGRQVATIIVTSYLYPSSGGTCRFAGQLLVQDSATDNFP